MLRPYQTVTFAGVKKGLPDPIQDLKKATDADTSPKKIDVGVGVYRNERGKYHEFQVVRHAKRVLDAQDLGHDYNPTTGIPTFTRRAARLLFGERLSNQFEGRIASVQTVGGTGANRIGAAFLRRNLYGPEEVASAYFGEPAWGNYRPLFENAGFQVTAFAHSARGATQPDFSSIQSALESAPPKSVFILQASCHNPTGLEYTREQWQTIAETMLHKRHFAFFDAAYLGFGSAKEDAADDDAWALRHFADRGVDMLVCQSFSKTFGLYSERVGALHVPCQTSDITANVLDQLRLQTRWEISSCPAYGAHLVDIILADPALTRQWNDELRAAAARIESNRSSLHDLLVNKLKTPGSWDHIVAEKGLFSYLQLTKPQIVTLAERHHVYLPPNGRINVAGLNRDNIESAARAIDSVATATA